MNDNNAISIKPIKDLFGLKFFIPNYQRGYRWDAQQAIDLLEDISAFMKKTNGNPSEIYCIQPLVVQSKEEDNLLEDVRRAESIEKVKELLQSSSWSVIDGQQRLTTIYLILSCLGKNSYFIKYETREKSEEYLQNFSEDKNKNIDYYHLFNVRRIKIIGASGKKKIIKKSFLEKYLFIKKHYDDGTFIAPGGTIDPEFRAIYLDFYSIVVGIHVTPAFIDEYFEIMKESKAWGKKWDVHTMHGYVAARLEPYKNLKGQQTYQCSFISKLSHIFMDSFY